MAARTAARFTPSPSAPAPGPADRCHRPRRQRSAESLRWRQGLLLLAAGGSATTGCAAPAIAQASPPAEVQRPVPRPDATTGTAAGAPTTSGSPLVPEAPVSEASAAAEPGVPSPLWAPAEPVSTPGADGRRAMQDRLAQGAITVRSGETLWSLTSDLLGPHAAPQDVARAWPLLWKANADQIRDPDRVLAGTVLLVPAELLPEP